MSAHNFTVTEHTSPCSYIRQYPHGVKNDDAVLQLAVKEYRPLKAPKSGEQAVTIIAAHGNGFAKEMYEPLFDDLQNASKPFAIDSIWIADQANMGASYQFNADVLGDDQNWIDHSLDLFLLINKFRSRMKTPFIGIGHSMGGAQLAYLASMHPRLFHSLVLLDPVLLEGHPPGPHTALFSSLRREKWESRAKAETTIPRSPFFKAMDPRALSNFLKYGLKDTSDGSVVLATTKPQEAWIFARSNFAELSEDREKERLLNPEFIPYSQPAKLLSARGDMVAICDTLPHLRPHAFYIYGKQSSISPPSTREYQRSITGTGRGGNGGVAEGAVKQEVLEGCGHLCAFEKPTEIAEKISAWMEDEVGRWKREKEFWSTIDTKKSKNGMTELSDEWLRVVKLATTTERPVAKTGAKL